MSLFLDKLTSDPFTYAVGMKSGTVFTCESATLYTDDTRGGDRWWLQLRSLGGEGVTVWDSATHLNDRYLKPSSSRGHSLPRGVDVRTSEVEWIADAPWGS